MPNVEQARMFILFKAPPEKDLEWDDADVEGLEGNLLTCQPTPTAPPSNSWPWPATSPRIGWRVSCGGGRLLYMESR
jgi:hypothetical protein